MRGDPADRWWRDARRRRMLAGADLCVGVLAGLIAAETTAGAAWAIAALPVWVVAAKLLGLYDRDHRAIRHLTFDELPELAGWTAACTVGLALILSLTPGESMNVAEAALVWVAALGAALVLRGAARGLWRQITAPELTAVLGNGELAWAARRKVELFHDLNLRLVEDGESPLPQPGAGGVEGLRPLARKLDRLILASEHIDPALIGQLVALCREEQVKFSVVSPLRGRAGAAPELSEIADLPVLEYDTWDVSRSTLLIKRVFDVVVSGAVLVVLAPLLPVIAVLIKLDSPGPVFFSQDRAGMGGRPFRLFKLRTMTRDAEAELERLVEFDRLPEPVFKLRDDPRVTRIGKLLRRFSIDELPQLWNVLRGDMSIVGPRPELIPLVERYQPEHRLRLAVKPGMTGPMQVFGRGALNFRERVAVELDYVENISLARDLRILAQTLPAVLRGTGAY